MLGIRFEKLIANNKKQSVFEQLLSLFLEIMVHTSGDVDETFKWLKWDLRMVNPTRPFQAGSLFLYP